MSSSRGFGRAPGPGSRARFLTRLRCRPHTPGRRPKHPAGRTAGHGFCSNRSLKPRSTAYHLTPWRDTEPCTPCVTAPSTGEGSPPTRTRQPAAMPCSTLVRTVAPDHARKATPGNTANPLHERQPDAHERRQFVAKLPRFPFQKSRSDVQTIFVTASLPNTRQ
jgi:hypothetical protein